MKPVLHVLPLHYTYLHTADEYIVILNQIALPLITPFWQFCNGHVSKPFLSYFSWYQEIYTIAAVVDA